MSNTDHYDYVIIGGGLAGISAALEINKISSTPSPSILIIEANDCLGGRITPSFKLKSTNNKLLSFDMGAQYIYRDHSNYPALKFIESKDNLRSVTEDSPWFADVEIPIFYNGENIIENVDIQLAMSSFKDVLKEPDFLKNISNKWSLYEQIKGKVNPQDKKSYSLDLIALYYLCQYEQWLGLPLNEVSMKHQSSSMFNDFTSDVTVDTMGTSMNTNDIYTGAFLPCVDQIAKYNNITTLLNTKVSSISKYDDDEVRLLLQGKRVCFGKKVIYTCSINVLKRHLAEQNFFRNIEFPEEKKTALNALSMGYFLKIYLSYDSRSNLIDKYLNEEKFYIIMKTTRDVELVYIRHDCKSRVMAITLSHKLSEESTSDLKSTLKTIYTLIFINGIDNVNEAKYTVFDESEDFLGSRSCLTKYAVGNENDILARPIDNLVYFAGEATHTEYQGSLHGTFLSGIRVASEVTSN